jgi:glutathione S-transferase
MSYQLYGAALSPFVRKTRAFMLEKGLEYHAIHVDPFNFPPDYDKINPLKRIPALDDDGKQLADSAVICAYLEHKHPEPALYPASPYSLARCLWFEKYADYEVAPLATFTVFRQRLLMPLFGKACKEEKVQQVLTESLPPLLDYLESQIEDKEYLVDDRLTVADIALASQFVNLEHGGEARLLDRWPGLKAHRDRLHGRGSFQQLLEGERKFVSQFKKPA